MLVPQVFDALDEPAQNGSVTEYLRDGYGTVWRVRDTSGANAVERGRFYINDSLPSGRT